MSQKLVLEIDGQIVNIAVWPDGPIPDGWRAFVEGDVIAPVDDPTTPDVDEAVRLAEKALAIKELPTSIRFLNESERGIASTLFPEWRAGIAVAVDEYYRWEGTVYQVIQAHTTQAGWEPPNVPALFTAV